MSSTTSHRASRIVLPIGRRHRPVLGAQQEILCCRVDRHRRHVRRLGRDKQRIEERPVGFVVALWPEREGAVRRRLAYAAMAWTLQGGSTKPRLSFTLGRSRKGGEDCMTDAPSAEIFTPHIGEAVSLPMGKSSRWFPSISGMRRAMPLAPHSACCCAASPTRSCPRECTASHSKTAQASSFISSPSTRRRATIRTIRSSSTERRRPQPQLRDGKIP